MVRTTTCWGTRNPTWIDEFSFVIDGPHETVRIFLLEERKRGVQKQLGEVLLSVAGLEQNQVFQNSYPVIGDKGVTIGELRIRVTYAVDIILPTADYNDLLGILILPEMPIVRHLAAVTKEKSVTARHLIHVFQARDQAEGFIRTIVKEEIEQTATIEVLFRGNTVCTKAMDHFMKLVGSLYQREVLMPIIEVVMRETQSLEIQKEKLTSTDDWKRNLARLQKLTELLLQRIFQSINHCPPPIRNLLKFIRETAAAKFKDSSTVKHTSVSSFIFLRFFVPAVLNPKLFGLTANMPSELHMRIFTLIAGVLQKLANLTRYREQDQHICALNTFLGDNFSKTRNFIDELVDVAPTAFRQMQRRMSIANSIQIDIHLAGLVRELQACRSALSTQADKIPLLPKLFSILDTINKKLESVQYQINQEETALAGLTKSSGDGLDTLLSKVIQAEVQMSDNGKITTVKRATPDDPLPEGAMKARQRSGSFLSRGLKKIAGRKPAVSVVIPPSKMNGRLSGPSLVPGSRAPPSTPSSDISRRPLVRSTTADELLGASAGSITSSSSINLKHSTESLSSLQHQHSQLPMSSSVGSAPSTMPVRMMQLKSSGTGTDSASSSPSLSNGNLDIINQYREAMRLNTKLSSSLGNGGGLLKGGPLSTAAAPSGVPSSQHITTSSIAEPWFAEANWGGMSDIEAMEAQTDYHGLSATVALDQPESSEMGYRSGNDTSDDDEYLVTGSEPFVDISDSQIPTIEEEEEEVEELDEVVVVKLDVDLSALEREFDILEQIISDIKAVPLPLAPKKDPKELLPDIEKLERVVEELEEAIVLTTPKVHVGSEGLTCKYCLGSIDTGSRFLVVMGQNFHEGHLNCNICSRDLSEIAFQWYKEKSYCFECYKKGHGIRPICHACNEPIITATYTQALGKYWHPEHFCCTVCKAEFPDGTFYNYEGRPYCSKHQNKGQALPDCGGCRQPIADPNYIEALGQKWHSHHFCCDICGIQLVGQFVTYEKEADVTGKACEHHFNT